MIEPAMIKRYREHISKLKLDVNVRLGIAYDEQDHPFYRPGVGLIRRPACRSGWCVTARAN